MSEPRETASAAWLAGLNHIRAEVQEAESRGRVAAYRCLVVEIALPDYNIEGLETDEDAAVAMDLATESVGLVFLAHEGDDPGVFVRPMEGRVVSVKVVDRG